MKSSMTLLPVSGRFALLGSIVLVCTVFLLGCGGSDSAPAPDSGAAEAPGDEEAGEPEAMPESEDEGASEAASSEEASEPTEEAEDSAAMEEPAEESEDAAAKETAATAPAETSTEETPATTAPVAEEVTDPRPEDVVAWQEDDFRSAKQDRDPKLLDAVAYLGENYSGDPDAANLLVELLTVPEDPEPEPKPEPKVEKKPARSLGSGSGSGSGEYGMEEGYDEYPEEEMDEYQGESEEDMYAREMEMYESEMEGSSDGMYSGSGGNRRKPSDKTPLAASYVSLTGGIVRALGANGTSEARSVLENLLKGEVPTGNDRAAVGAVLRTLVDYPSTENDALLRKALTTPEAYRKTSEQLTTGFKKTLDDTGQAEEGESEDGDASTDVDTLVAAQLANTVSAEDIQDTTLPLVEKSASMRLRYDLAAYLIGDNPSEKVGPRLQELVTSTHPLNVQAQIGLYRFPKTPSEMRDSFERYFTSYASSTLGRMFAVSTDEGADLDVPISDGGDGASGGSERGWSGFGDSTTQQPPRGSGSRGTGGSSYGEGGSEMMEEEGAYEPEEEYEDRADMEGMSSPDYMGEEGYPGEGSGSGEYSGSGGSRPQPLKGPGAADKLSIQKFNEVAAGDPNLPYELARQLWGNELGATLATKMSSFASLEEGAQILALASYIPTDKMRSQLFKTLQDHWVEGPEALSYASAASEVGISDPGYLIILKSMPRRMRPDRPRGEPTEEQRAQYAWMEAVYNAVVGLCEKLQKAADNEQIATAEVIESLPFRIHSTDSLTHVYAIDWQKKISSRLAGVPVDPMRVYYLRFEENAPFSRIHGTYKRAVPSANEYPLMNGLWIDGSKSGPQGTKISMDVIIERPDIKQNRKATEAEPLVIHVLYVEVDDPNPAKTAAAG